MKKLPLSIQSFEVLRNDKAIYVDKTKHIYKLINNSRIYFLSRPRRFGKSLLISTFKALFKGNKDIFEGLYIYDKWDWSKKYPVIHLDFTELAYDTPKRLENSLSDFINNIALEYSITLTNSEIETRFSELIKKLRESIGQQVVVLIDEYDKPMIDSLNKAKEVHQEIKETLHNFYQVIKGSDEHLKFMFMTGVSRFSGLSVFSALNNLNDITMNNKYTSICGYTQEELESSFKEYIETTSEFMGINKEELLSKIKYWYNGYSWDGKISVYNPFSTLSFFDNVKFKGYWFSTGTPTFLIKQIKKKDGLESFAEPKVVNDVGLSGSSFSYDKVNSVSLLFQTGYLTIKKEDIIEDESQYTIDFPNYEVRSAFLSDLLEAYIDKDINEVQALRTKLIKALRNKDSTALEEILQSLYANIPYNLHIAKEAYYHSLFLMLARTADIEVDGEVLTDKGRIDVILKYKDFIVVVEIKYVKDNKLEEMIQEAIKQIKDKKYYEKYINNNPILLAIAFNENKDISCKFENI